MERGGERWRDVEEVEGLQGNLGAGELAIRAVERRWRKWRVCRGTWEQGKLIRA